MANTNSTIKINASKYSTTLTGNFATWDMPQVKYVIRFSQKGEYEVWEEYSEESKSKGFVDKKIGSAPFNLVREYLHDYIVSSLDRYTPPMPVNELGPNGCRYADVYAHTQTRFLIEVPPQVVDLKYVEGIDSPDYVPLPHQERERRPGDDQDRPEEEPDQFYWRRDIYADSDSGTFRRYNPDIDKSEVVFYNERYEQWYSEYENPAEWAHLPPATLIPYPGGRIRLMSRPFTEAINPPIPLEKKKILTAKVAVPWQYFWITFDKVPENEFGITHTLGEIHLFWAQDRLTSIHGQVYVSLLPNMDARGKVCLGDVFPSSNASIAVRAEEIVGTFFEGVFNRDYVLRLPYPTFKKWEEETAKDPFVWMNWKIGSQYTVAPFANWVHLKDTLAQGQRAAASSMFKNMDWWSLLYESINEINRRLEKDRIEKEKAIATAVKELESEKSSIERIAAAAKGKKKTIGEIK